VDAAGNAVLDLHVHLGNVEVLVGEGGSSLDVLLGGTVHHVSSLESGDSLVLSNESAAVDASDSMGKSLVLLETLIPEIHSTRITRVVIIFAAV
jgi:hypothetical protein